MKKKKKGFTLTELIAVIAVLALLLLIGIPAYNSIRKRTLEKQYNNLVELIETTAEKFAGENSTNITNIQELIDNGLLETDDGSNIYDPRDNSIMNCLLISIDYNKGNYNATLLSTKECNLDKAKEENSAINILTTGISNTLYTDKTKWLGENVIFSVDTTNMTVEEASNIIEYKWVSGNGQTLKGLHPTMQTDVSTLLNTSVNVEVTTKNDNKYYATTTIKIDNENPIISDVEVSGGNDWTKGREVKISATDQAGSGVEGYYLGKNNCSEDSSFSSSPIFNIASSEIINDTNYYVCVKDKVGNIGKYEKQITISVKDKTKPKCEWSGESTSWTSGNRTITLKCKDSESGCDEQYDGETFEYSTTKQTDTIERVIKDRAGNETICKKTVNVYVDKSAPTTPSISNPSGGNWVYNSFNVTATSSDTGSGINNWYWSYDNKNWYTDDPSTISSDKKTYTSTYSAEGSRTAYIKVCDGVGHCSQSSTDIKIDKCESKTTSYGSWSQCNKVCGTGTRSRSVTYKGISGRTCSTDTQTENCNTQSCTPTVTISGNISGWVCGSCRDDCSTTYRVTSGGTCLKAQNGQYGNTMGKVTYTKSNNTVTFNWEIRQGAYTRIGKSYWVKFIIKNSSSTIYTSYLKKAEDAKWSGGTTHTGSITYTFNSKGTYYIYIEGNSDNPNFDMNFGTITVS